MYIFLVNLDNFFTVIYTNFYESRGLHLPNEISNTRRPRPERVAGSQLACWCWAFTLQSFTASPPPAVPSISRSRSPPLSPPPLLQSPSSSRRRSPASSGHSWPRHPAAQSPPHLPQSAASLPSSLAATTGRAPPPRNVLAVSFAGDGHHQVCLCPLLLLPSCCVTQSTPNPSVSYLYSDLFSFFFAKIIGQHVDTHGPA